MPFVAFLILLFAYLLVARAARKKIPETDPAKFFLALRGHDAAEFGASQTAYSLQMATVYPYFLFAFFGQWWLAAWNTIWYAVAIGLLYAFLPAIARKTNLAGSYRSLHEYIARQHAAPGLRSLTAWLSVLAFGGLAVFEIVWGARVLKVLMDSESAIYYLAIIFLAFYMVLQIRMGGQVGTIWTDQYELAIAYVGLHGLIVWLLIGTDLEISKLSAPLLLPVVVVIGCIMLLMRAKKAVSKGKNRYFLLADLITIGSLAILISVIILEPGFWTKRTFTTLQVRPAVTGSLFGIGEFKWELAAFALMPLFFQFADFTNWQRIASLRVNAEEGVTKSAQRGLLQMFVESPLSWLLPVLLGIMAAQVIHQPAGATNWDAWDALVGRATSLGGVGGGVFASVVVVGLCSVFMSTADSLISAIGYAYAFDIYPPTRRIMDDAEDPERVELANGRSVIGAGRWFIGASVIPIALLFVLADTFSAVAGEKVLGIFLAFFAPMIAFAPSIFMPGVFGRAARGIWAWLSIGVGSGLGAVSGIVALRVGGVWQWVAPCAAFVFSWALYLVGLMFGGRKV